MLSTHEEEEDNDEDQPLDPKRKRKARSVSAVRTAIECAYQILQQRIISDPNDMMGILLFGTEETKFPEGATYEHCYLLMDLDIPDATSIKRLKEIVEDEKEFNKLMKPSKTKASMANVLFGANQIFTTKAANFTSRRLFIITDDDDPHKDEKTTQKAAITRARDLYDLGIRIEPFYVSNPGQKPFDTALFYEDIIYRSGEADDDDAPLHLKPTNDGKIRLKEMINGIKSKTTPKRAYFTSQIELGPGVKIGVKGFLMMKRQEPSRACWVYTHGEKSQIAQLETQRIAEDTVKKVTSEEIVRAYKFGGEQVLFTPEELKQLRHFDDPIIRIIGFKPKSELKFEYNVRTSTFIYPDETDIVGSIRTFTALHKKLLKSDKIGIAWHVPRRNAGPVLAALVPTEEIIQEGAQLVPAGIFLIQLPYADDIRQNPPVPHTPAPPELVRAMRKIIQQLHIPAGYVPEKYSNPALQWHYKIIQAIALEEDMPDIDKDFIDFTLPKYKAIRKHAGEKVVDWAHALEEATVGMGSLSLPPTAAGKKRASPAVDGSAPKKVKQEAGEDQVRKLYNGGNLNKLTVVQLREFLGSKTEKTDGKKQDLVDRVETFFEKSK